MSIVTDTKSERDHPAVYILVVLTNYWNSDMITVKLFVRACVLLIIVDTAMSSYNAYAGTVSGFGISSLTHEYGLQRPLFNLQAM
jgi:hypothetical protein